MSNPPAGWYPDPTGQANTIRWWNGTQWTNKTEKESEATGTATDGADQPDTAEVDPAPAATTTPEPTQPPEPTQAPEPTQRPEPTQAAEPTQAQPSWTQPAPTPDPQQSWGQTGQQPGWGHQTGQQGPPHQAGPAPQAGQVPWDQATQQSWQVQATGQQASPYQGQYQGPTHQTPPPEAPNPWQSAGPGNPPYPPQQQQQSPQPSFGPPLSPTFDRPERSGKGPRDPRLPLVIAGAVVLVLIIAGGVWFLLRPDNGDPEGGQSPGPAQSSGNPTQNSTTPPTSAPTTPSTTPTVGPSRTPGQSRNPAMHGGSRIASDAISFPRLRPPWSDKKLFARQVTNSHGQYVLLQQNIAGQADWYATIFVGSLSTGVLYNGNPQATANDLALELRNTYYTPIPITARTVRQFAVNRTGHRGWAVQQIITTTARGVQSPTLVLMVAVFDLGDGTAVAYVSEIPPNRRDLSVFEQLVFKAVHVG